LLRGDIGNEKKKPLLTFSLAKPRYNSEAILKNCEMFVHEDIRYVTNLFCKNMLKITTP
jgi:hypothetical protein